jgi:membrane associated rhomboid family serine protease
MYNQRQGLDLSPVVKILLIANIVMYVGTSFILPSLAPYLWAYYPSSPNFLAHQLFTHMFMHDPKGLGHIFFNMFCLITFGPVIEMVWREKKFFFFYLFCGFGAIGLHYAVEYWQIENGIRSLESAQYSPLMGASGCLSGVMVAFAMLYPNQKIGMMFIPIYFPAKFAIPAIVAVDLFLGISNSQPGVAHFAHLGGALSGFLLIQYWWRTGK